MSDTVTEQIAKQLHAAFEQGGETYAQALAKYWSDGAVDASHEPPLPMDGPMTRDDMLNERRLLTAAFSALMPDFKYADVYSRVVGDLIYLFGEQTGTLADGTKIRSPLCSRFTVKNSKIEKAVLNIDPISVEPLHRAFTALAAAQGDAH